jgi:hypothetical protein
MPADVASVSGSAATALAPVLTAIVMAATAASISNKEPHRHVRMIGTSASRACGCLTSPI